MRSMHHQHNRPCEVSKDPRAVVVSPHHLPEEHLDYSGQPLISNFGWFKKGRIF